MQAHHTLREPSARHAAGQGLHVWLEKRTSYAAVRRLRGVGEVDVVDVHDSVLLWDVLQERCAAAVAFSKGAHG